ncbi:MAG: tRNA (adenosine(37)-N6)-threonylcarbamoyltransferase complex dimerization subunit type 1 TsaB, partial [Thermotogaceae bacterium]|nr:tRNA (adenosine(37)-N6)-threonylcarbamoyltransferase complex dimerization subunit type 1 TsaB [Thermotogaceae bacterium]
MILALDTSTSFVSVALKDGNGSISLTYSGKEKHAVSLPRVVSAGFEALKKTMNDVKNLGVGIGPGTLTGIRVGVGFVIGIAASLNLDVVVFDSLYAIAKGVEGFKYIAVLRKARKGWVYYEIFNEDYQSLEGPNVGRIDEVKNII